MKHKQIKKAIEKLSPWCQRYQMDGFYTTEEKISGEDVWPSIRSVMVDDLHGMKILDLSADAAYYSMMLALEGAEVIALQSSKRYFQQAMWTKHYFEEKHGQKFPVTLLKKTASELDYPDMGRFDYVLALSVLSFIGSEFGEKYSEGAITEQNRVITELCRLTDKIVVEIENDRLENSVAYYNKIFLKHEFYMTKKVILERPIMVYGRLEKHEDYGWRRRNS